MENRTPSISKADRLLLVSPVTLEEVQCAVMAMQSFKAPGSDRFQALFYKQYWSIVGEDLHQMVAKAFREGRYHPNMLDILLVLIPKVDNPSHLNELRPISLCNVAYKVITKVLVNRLRPLLSELVGPLQGSFILGRGMGDNIILAHEVMHTIYNHKKRGRFGSNQD
uniref:Uncharacterized protein n=1 Tax=Lotus japonicus TaxID=34305 RepID=I3T158_LOTJA|nr:unknown [Lotus japonicus]